MLLLLKCVRVDFLDFLAMNTFEWSSVVRCARYEFTSTDEILICRALMGHVMAIWTWGGASYRYNKTKNYSPNFLDNFQRIHTYKKEYFCEEQIFSPSSFYFMLHNRFIAKALPCVFYVHFMFVMTNYHKSLHWKYSSIQIFATSKFCWTLPMVKNYNTHIFFKMHAWSLSWH